MTESMMNSAVLVPNTAEEDAILAAYEGNKNLPEMTVKLEVISHPSDNGRFAVRISQSLDAQALVDRIRPAGGGTATAGPFGRGDMDDPMVWDDYTHERHFGPEEYPGNDALGIKARAAQVDVEEEDVDEIDRPLTAWQRIKVFLVDTFIR